MEFEKLLYEKLLACPWLEQCGTPQKEPFSLPVAWVRKPDDAIKKIASVRWENVCLAEQGNFTEFLAQNHKTEYNQLWNKLVDTVKTEYLPSIRSRVEEACCKRGLPKDVSNDICFNLLSIFMISYFSQYYQSEFFHSLLEVYSSGHLPCGWQGRHPNGKLYVY